MKAQLALGGGGGPTTTPTRMQKPTKKRAENAEARAGLASVNAKFNASTNTGPVGKRERRHSKMVVEQTLGTQNLQLVLQELDGITTGVQRQQMELG